MPPIKFFWKVLLAFLVAGTLGAFAAWATLLTRLCSDPSAHALDAQHVIAYSCHGMIVYMSRFEDGLHHWLIPIGGIFILLTVVTTVLALLSAAKVRIDVQVHYRNPSEPRT